MFMPNETTRHVLQHWSDPESRKSIAVKRRNMRVSLKQYLHKVPMLGGVPANLADYVPTATKLADAYRALVVAEQVGHGGDRRAATSTSLVFGPLFAELWIAACSIQPRSMPCFVPTVSGDNRDDEGKRAASILEFAKSLPEYEVDDWLAQETVATASLLADAYVKASAELKAVCESSQEDAVVLRHHTSVLAGNISDMIALVMEDAERIDLQLPDDHIHKTSVLTQERARSARKD